MRYKRSWGLRDLETEIGKRGFHNNCQMSGYRDYCHKKIVTMSGEPIIFVLL